MYTLEHFEYLDIVMATLWGSYDAIQHQPVQNSLLSGGERGVSVFCGH